MDLLALAAHRDVPRVVDGTSAHYLESLYGPVMPGGILWRVLGFPTPDAFRKAAVRGTLPVQTFTLPKRRGRFARTQEVVAWLQALQSSSADARPEAPAEDPP